MGRNKGKGRQNRNKMSEQEYQAEISRLKKKIEDSKVKKGKQDAKKKVKEKQKNYEEKRKSIVEELQNQREFFQAALESLKHINANKYKSKEELKQYTDKVKSSIQKFGYSPSTDDIKKNHRRYKYMLAEQVQKLNREMKKDNPKLKMKSLNDNYYEKGSKKAEKKLERAQKYQEQINRIKKYSDRKKSTNKFLAEHGDKIVGLVKDSVNEKGVDWGNLITGAGMFIPNPAVQVVSAIGNVGWNAYKGWKNKQKEALAEKMSLEQRRKALAYEKYKAKKKMKRESNQGVINNREMMLYATRQMNRKHRHYKLPVSDLKWWDNMREFEKQIQIQQVNKAQGIWDNQFGLRLQQHEHKQDERAKKKEERQKQFTGSGYDAHLLSQVKKFAPALVNVVEDHLRRAPIVNRQLTGTDLARKVIGDKEPILRNRARDLYRYEKNSKDKRDHPENYWVELPERQELPAYYDARIMSPNISALELKGMVKKHNRLYNALGDILKTAVSVGGVLGKYALPRLFELYADKIDPNTTSTIISAITSALGKDSAITAALEESLKNKKIVEHNYEQRLWNARKEFLDNHTKYATDLVNKLDDRAAKDKSHAFIIQKALSEDYDFRKNPLENLRDNERLQEMLLSNFNYKFDSNGNETNTPFAFYKIEKLIQNDRISPETREDFNAKLEKVGNYIKEDGRRYNFETDPLELKVAFRRVLDDLTKDGVTMAKYDRKANDDTKLRKAFAGAFLGNPFLDVKFDKDHPLNKLYEAYKDPHSEDLKTLTALGMNAAEMKRRGKAISEYAIFNNLSPQDKLSLFESSFLLTPEEFKANIDEPVKHHKVQNGIDEATNIWEDISGAVRAGYNLYKNIRGQKAEETLDEQAKDVEDYRQSLLNFNEFIIDAVDGNVNDAFFNKEKWYEDNNNIIRDINRNMAIKAFASQVLSIGIPSKKIFEDWFRDKMNQYHDGDIHPFSINNERSPEVVRRFANHLASEWYDFMKYTRLPVNTHFYNRSSNTLALQNPSGWSPEQEAMMELKLHKSRKSFELRNALKPYAESARFIKHNAQDENTRESAKKELKSLKRKMEDLATEGYQEREFISNLTKQNRNFYHLINIMNEKELKLMDIKKAEEAYKAVEFMPIDRINSYMNDHVRPKLNKYYDPYTETYNTTLDFSGTEDYMVANNSSLNRTIAPMTVTFQQDPEALAAHTTRIDNISTDLPLVSGSPMRPPPRDVPPKRDTEPSDTE